MRRIGGACGFVLGNMLEARAFLSLATFFCELLSNVQVKQQSSASLEFVCFDQ